MDFNSIMETLFEPFHSTLFQIIIAGLLSLSSALYIFWFHRRKKVAREVLEGTPARLLNDRQKIFSKRFFVKPLFIDKTGRKTTFRDIKNSIIKGNNIDKKGILVICSEAGLGKTRLMEYLAYKLKIRDLFRARLFRDRDIENDTLFIRLRYYSSIEKIISKIKEKKPEYILLDGFDEFKLMKDENPDTLLKSLLDGLSDFEYEYSKIVITSRKGFK